MAARVIERAVSEASARLPRAVRGRLMRRFRPVRWGNLRRVEPRSRSWGSSRGDPLDRWYIERFIQEHVGVIRGRVLEIMDPRYTLLGGTAVTRSDILDIDPRNDRASIVADLGEPGSLPAAQFDCLVITQTLHYVRDLDVGMANLWQALAPGGTLLLTLPSICRFDPDLLDVDRWRLGKAGMAELVARSCPGGVADVRAHGNVLVATAFLHGLSQQDLSPAELDVDDPLFPVVTMAAVRKPA